MNELNETAAIVAVPAILKRIKFSWLAYGALAYVGLRLMRKYGVFAQPAGKILGVVDGAVSKGTHFVTDRFAATGKTASSTAQNQMTM